MFSIIKITHYFNLCKEKITDRWIHGSELVNISWNIQNMDSLFKLTQHSHKTTRLNHRAYCAENGFVGEYDSEEEEGLWAVRFTQSTSFTFIFCLS